MAAARRPSPHNSPWTVGTKSSAIPHTRTQSWTASFTMLTESNSPAKACDGPEANRTRRVDHTASPMPEIHRPERARFNEEIARSPRTERDYFAWAQSFMSGVLMRAPQGVDEAPRSFPAVAPLQNQAAFLRNFCSRNPTDDAVLALYLRLRKMETNARQNALERTNLCRSSTITGLRRIVPNTS